MAGVANRHGAREKKRKIPAHETPRNFYRASFQQYHDIIGGWDFGGDMTLFVDKIQADPFAQPSKCHLRVPQSVACFPPSLFDTPAKRVPPRPTFTALLC